MNPANNFNRASSPVDYSANQNNQLDLFKSNHPNSIDGLKNKYPLHKSFRSIAFKRDAMIVALICAKRAVSTRLGLKDSAEVKKDVISKMISKLESLDIDNLTNDDINQHHKSIAEILNTQRATLFKTSQTDSGLAYSTIIAQTTAYFNELSAVYGESYNFDDKTFSIKDVKQGNLINHDLYRVFEHVFVNPKGILTESEDPRTQEMSDAIIEQIKQRKLFYSKFYRVFEHVFVNPKGIFANSKDPRAKEISKVVIDKLSKYKVTIDKLKKLKSFDAELYSVFEHVFVNPKGIFANSEDPRTQEISKAVINRIDQGHLCDSKFYSVVFEHVFVNPKGILTESEDPRTQEMSHVIASTLIRGSFSSNHLYSVFEHVFVNPKGIFANSKDPRTQEMSDTVIDILADGKFNSDDFYRVFEHVFVNPKGIFANSEDPRTQKMSETIFQMLKSNNITNITNNNRMKISKFYLSLDEDHPSNDKLGAIFIKLLEANKLQDPAVITKAARARSNCKNS